VVTAEPEWYERLRFVQNAVGAVPGPMDCFLVHRGLRTLHLRMEAHARSAAAVVKLLRETPDAEDVRWPGFSAWSASATPARPRSPPAPACSRWPSHSAGSSP